MSNVVDTVTADEKVKLDGKNVTVKRSCKMNSGGWYCVTHLERFANQIEKDFHTSRGGRHVMAWICREHGVEQP